MPVTPQDIQNKEFREAFRGYNEDDVDTFLDEIAVDYARLYQENQRMKVQLAALQQEIARAPDRRGATGAGAAPPASPPPTSPTLRELEATAEDARAAAEAALEDAKRRATELVQRAEQRAREIDDLTARRAKDVDSDASAALTDAQQRVGELRRQEAEIRRRIRAFLEQQLTSLDVRTDADTGPSTASVVVERMSRELGHEESQPEPAVGSPEGFWKAE